MAPSLVAMSTEPVTDDIDLFADEVLIDPYPTYARLRDLGAVVHLPANDVYVLTRYDVIRDALGDWETLLVAASIGFNPMVNEALTGTSLASDPPVHTRLRATLSENLSPRALRGLKDQIETKADALVADLVERGSFEAIDDLAREFPLEVVADLIGFTGHVRDNMLRWGQAAMQVIGPMNERTAESFPIAGELYDWCSTVTRRRSRARLGRAAASSTPRRAATFRPTRPATSSTSTSAPGSTRRSPRSATSSRSSRPTRTSSTWCAGPDPRAGCVQRGTPLLGAGSRLGSLVTRDVEIDGAVVPAGSQVAILFGAGNRDPRHYETRTPSWSSATRSTTCPSATARTAAPARVSPGSRRTPSSRHSPARCQRLVVGDAVRVPSNITRSIEELRVLEVVPA